MACSQLLLLGDAPHGPGEPRCFPGDVLTLGCWSAATLVSGRPNEHARGGDQMAEGGCSETPTMRTAIVMRKDRTVNMDLRGMLLFDRPNGILAHYSSTGRNAKSPTAGGTIEKKIPARINN